MQAVIMAGGKGTRLRAITKDLIPKPMASVCGKPILEWQIETLRKNGIKDVIIVVGHLGDTIETYFGNGTHFGVHITYIREQEPLGTAGAFYYLKTKLLDDIFLLVFGDVIFDISISRMLAFHKESHAEATLFVHPNSHPFDSDLVITDNKNRIIKFDSKNNIRNYWYDNCVNAGLYIFNKCICDYVTQPKKVDLERDILDLLVQKKKKVYAYRSPEYIKDVGTIERIQKAEEELRSGYVNRRNLQNLQKAIFLDRDGTINKKNGLVFAEEQFQLESCAIEAIEKINQSGYLAIIITNQPVVARGLCTIGDVETIHKKLKTLLGREGVYVDDIKYCPHHPDKGYPEENPLYKIPCHCRKPDIGMIEECVKQYHIDLNQSWMIGDTTTDIQTGINAGMKTILVQTGEAGNDKKYNVQPNLVCRNLLEAVYCIIRGE